MKKIIEWSVGRPVVANLLMLFLLLVGGYCAVNMRKEMFPEFSLDRVEVSVIYKGASVEEIEESICTKIEEKITGIEGVKKVTSTAIEGKGTVIAELESYANVNRVLNDIKNQVDQIDTFPTESERPLTVELIVKRPVIKVAVYGDMSETVLTAIADEVKRDLLAMPGITQAVLFGNREYEISIEIPESNLRKYGLTLTQVAEIVKQNSLDLPGGTLRAESGKVLIRTKGQRYTAKEFEDLPIISRVDGTLVRLNRIATISDTFEEVDIQARMNGEPAVIVRIEKTSKQDAVEIADKVKRYVEEKKRELPSTVHLAVWDDDSRLIESRLDLLTRNALQGLALVLVILALFLRLRVAFWVAMGIPISMMGAFYFLTLFDYTINMISMFSFIVVLGIVVDDAIVIGENVYSKMMLGGDSISATVDGTAEVAAPVINSVATTLVAFGPMLFVAGTMGKFMKVFPIAIMTVLVVSLLEALLILPAHLAHMKRQEPATGRWNPLRLLEKLRSTIDRGQQQFVERFLVPFAVWSIRERYVFLASIAAILIFCWGIVAGGRLAFVFFPKVDSDRLSARLILPEGTSLKTTEDAVKKIEKSAREMASRYHRKDGQSVIRNMFSIVGDQLPIGVDRSATKGSHAADVIVELLPVEERNVSSSELVSVWRELVGEIPDALSLTFSSTGGGPSPGGKPIEIILLGDRMDRLLEASEKLKGELARFEGVQDVEDSYRPGKKELRISLKEGARQLGISLADMARQIRANFWGEEPSKIQRGTNEVIIRVRYPEAGRASRYDLEMMRVRTADNKAVPFGQVVEIEEYQGPSNIVRRYGRRSITVSADVDESRANAREIVNKLSGGFLNELKQSFPGVGVVLEGQQKETVESMSSLFKGLIVALFLIYILLANMFRTYTQPLIIMTAIPFAFIGIILGHLAFGMDITILSMFGVLALTGIVVNDSLLLLEASNREIDRGLTLSEALIAGIRDRFRQIILTTLSTAAGLLPLLMETSFQAQFLKPMAITVVFGLVTSTVLILLLVPCLAVIREDVLKWLGKEA